MNAINCRYHELKIAYIKEGNLDKVRRLNAARKRLEALMIKSYSDDLARLNEDDYLIINDLEL